MPTRLSQHRSATIRQTHTVELPVATAVLAMGRADGIMVHQLLAEISVPGGLHWN